MKRTLKIVVPLLLVAVLVAGVFPVTSQAASKTTYNVTLLKGSANVPIVSINDGTSAPTGASLEGLTFQLIVENKLKTEKVKSTGQKASYYPVKLPKKSFKAPTTEYPLMSGEGIAVVSNTLKSDGKGKLYVSGGDVDYTAVQGEKKAKIKYGDGKADPEGSLFLTITQVMPMTIKGTNKTLSKEVLKDVNLTTGTCSIIAQNVKGGLNGKSLPADAKSTKMLPDPFTGQAVDLDAGTGTLISVTGSMNVKNAMVNGMVDSLSAQVYVMKISK